MLAGNKRKKLYTVAVPGNTQKQRVRERKLYTVAVPGLTTPKG